MLQKTGEGYYQSSFFSSHDIIHGFTGRLEGDMRNDIVNRNRFMKSLGLDPDKIITVHQIHSNVVHTVTPEPETGVPEADGIVYKRIQDSGSSAILGVCTADCVPVLFADVQSGIIAAVHAGWRGTLTRIAEKAVEAMVHLGASADRITVVLGPHISMCCFTVGADVAGRFSESFSEYDQWMYRSENGQWHLSLAGCLSQQLIHLGIRHTHIDAHPVCTSCRTNEFHSYRRDSGESYGEMLGFITLREL